MKIYISILLIIVILNFQSCAQNKNWQELQTNKDSPIHQYDVDFIKYVAEEEIDEEFKNQEKFKFLNSFRSIFKINDESLLESDYMVKPNKNELLALYIKRKIKWNTFNRGIAKKSNQALLFDELSDFPSPNELLSFYYSEIFIQVLNKKDTYHPNKINLDFEKLKLTKEQGDIMFLTAMRYCGSQISSFSETRFPENCFRQTSFISKLPKFNGANFDEYQLSEFNDFLIHVDKRYPKMSFKERYIPDFEDAKSGYIKCQKAKKHNKYLTKKELMGGKWSFPIGEDCINYFQFEKDSVVVFDCELQEKIFGTYETNLDQIIIITTRSEYDNEFPANSRHRHKSVVIELRIDGKKLIDDKFEMEYIKIE